MRLIQYRFAPESLKNAQDIGRKIRDFFVDNNDTDISAISIGTGYVDEIIYSAVHLDHFADSLALAFKQSESYFVKNDVPMIFRSNRSCRFIVFEDDLLIRFCYSNDDPLVNFDDEDLEINDVSDILINTDLFDHI